MYCENNLSALIEEGDMWKNGSHVCPFSTALSGADPATYPSIDCGDMWSDHQHAVPSAAAVSWGNCELPLTCGVHVRELCM